MKSKRILSLILALLMLFSVLPFSALAEKGGLEETESVSEDDAFPSSDPLAGLTDKAESDGDPPEDETGVEDEAPETADSDLHDEGSNFDEDSQNTDGDWVEDGFQQPDLQTTDESEDEIESDEGTDGETEFSEGPDDPPADDEQEETGESDGGEESDTPDDSEEAQESNFSLDDLVLTEYDGSYIWYTLESSGHAYVKTKQAAPVFRDSGMNPAAVLCTLPDGEILLATDYDDRGGTNAVFVTVVTPEMDVVEGIIRESDLSKTVVTDEEIDLLTVERDYLMIDVNGTSCPALISAASFYGADAESDTDGEASEDNDADPDDTGEESDENGEDSETEDPFEEDDLETITLDPENLQIQTVEPIRLMGTRSYTYTIYADHDPTVPISTRPAAYMAGNRQGFTTIDQGNDGSDFRSIHQSYNMKGQTVTVLGFSRYHHAVITYEWYDSSAGITRRLLTEAAYMRPVEKTYTCTVRDSAGNIVPNHEVRVLDGKGNYVTTVMSDANGVARYTGLHLEVSDMLAFAEANYYENGTNTLIEDNDCATFVSECLTAGGFAVYGAYASNSEANEGQIGYGLYDRLTSWIGVPGTSYPSISSLSPGDVVFMMPQNNANYPYGHSMIIGQVDYASGQVLVYGHSSANKQEGDSNKMWISVSRIAYVAFTSMYNYTFDYSFTTPTPVPTTPPTQLPTQPPTQPPTAPPTSAPTPTPAPAKGRIKIIKTDVVYGTPLAGVVFDISLNGTIVGSMTTDTSGTAVSGELPPGKYDVTERSVPTGYTGIPFWTECQVPSGSTVEVKVTNQPIQFRVKIIKTDGLTGSPLPGAEFTITRKSTGRVAATLTTNANGEATSDLLPYGEYTVTESKAPATYVDQGFTATVNGTENNKTYELRVTNEPMKGAIRVIKTDALDGTPIAGVVFDIYQGSTKVGSMTTNANGVAESGQLPKGNYTVKEHALPQGYTGSLANMDCVVKSAETTGLKATNQPIQFRVKIVKKDGLTKESLPGAEFTITRKTGLPSHNGTGNGEVVATLTTNASGEAVSDLLTWGEYEVKESKVPEHFVDNHFVTTVTGSENDKVYEIRVENEPAKGWIRLVKTDSLDSHPIAGVQFDIYQNGEVVSTMTTDADGVAVSEALRKGRYTVKEHENPTGYTAELVHLDCEVFSDHTTELTASNTPIQFRVKIIKTDQLTNEPLAGAEFTITRKTGLPSHNGAGDGEVVAVLTTNASGEAVSDLLTWGEYEVKETKVPEHFVDNHFVTTVNGTENEKVYEIRVENEPTKGWLRLVKTDRLDDHPIAGVTFDILQDGQIVSSMTTDETGTAVSEPLNKGKYTVKERANPKGYTNDLTAMDCEVFSDVTTKLTADNQPIQSKIRIVKKDELTKAALAGAGFTITRISGLPSHNGEGDGQVVAVMITDADGVAESPLLTWGTYQVEETTVPEHFVDNHFSVNVVIRDDNLKTYSMTVENEPTKGWIQLVKTDALDRTPIAGVQFDIYYNDEYGSGLAATMTTNEEGVAKSPSLRKGRYLVKEHVDPTGYVTDLAMLDCEVRSDETTHISATNQPIQGRIKIIKRDELTKEALAGAEFTVTRVSGLPSHNGSNDGEVVAVITTDADGIAVTPLLTWGTYKVEETVVPVHYVDNHYSTEVTIDEENLKTYEVEVENEPTKGWIRLTKTDRKNGNPIAGVQFDIYYNDQYGEGLATTMTTGADGVAMSEPIRKGRYIVKEHGATAGYLFEEVTLECTVKSDEITDLAATNRPVGVKLKLFKRDQDEYTGRTADLPGTRGDGVLTGAVIQVLAGENITDRQGNILYEKGAVVVESLKTAGENASVVTEELWPGVYEIIELTPPTGYQSTDKHTIVDATGAARQSAEAVITYEGVVQNEVLYGSYAFVKFAGDNEIHDDAGLVETPEPGAVFQIYLKTAGSYDAARAFERDKITTDEYGKAKTKLLPYGIYTVQQTKAKKGFAIKAPFDIFIRGTEDAQNPPSMILNNEAIRYRLKFIKIDAETGNTITAAHTSFKLKDAEGNYVTQTVFYPHKEEIDTFTTDETGAVTLPETVNYGLYFAEEFKAPEGYLIQTKEQAIFVGDDTMDKPGEAYLLEFRIENEPVKGRILLEKKGLQLTGFEEKQDGHGNTIHQPIFEEKYLAGAVFEVHAAEDMIGKDGTLWYHADELVDTITTTAAGKDASKVLPLGRYYLVETQAPEGYIFSGERYEASLEYADDHTALVEITVQAKNDYLPAEITLTKEKEDVQVITEGDSVRQELTVTPGAGFLFGLYNDQDIRYDGGTLLADTLVATGVTDADGKLNFSGLYPHGKYYVRELSTLDGWKLNPNTFPVDLTPANRNGDNVIHVSLPEPVHDELIYTRVTITKTDMTGQTTIPGALIEVADSEGNVIYRAYTDEHGEIPDIPVTPGRYTFREILAPEGYELNKAEMSFSVDRDGNITGDTSIRDDYTRFHLLKLDENGRALPGVEFGLLNKHDEILFTAVSDAQGVVTFEKIPYGTYTVMETRPLPGYIAEDTTVEITVDGTFINPTLPLETVVNRKNTVLVKKVDQNGQPLAGAEFTLCDEFGERVTTAVSDRNGIVRFSGIPYGNYTIREIIAPHGYLLNRDVISLTVDKDYRSSEEPIATVVNRLKRLKYIKVDTSGKYLPGVEFTLINAVTGEEVETVTSNEKGEFIFTAFDYGVWIIRETEAPEGYTKMADITVSVDSDWVEPEPFTCVNIPNHYEFVKTDNEGNPLPGVKFTLEDSEGNILRDLLSGEDGIVHVTDLNPGTYIIREIETLEGFTITEESIEVVIDEHYIIPDEMFTLINYPIIQTGAGLEMTPLMWAGAGVTGAAMLLGVIFAIRGKGKKKRHRRK